MYIQMKIQTERKRLQFRSNFAPKVGNFHMKRMLCTPRQQHSSPIVNTDAVRPETPREVYSCCYLYHHKKKLVLFSSPPPQFPPHRTLE
jgi:hypothetical protein